MVLTTKPSLQTSGRGYLRIVLGEVTGELDSRLSSVNRPEESQLQVHHAGDMAGF